MSIMVGYLSPEYKDIEELGNEDEISILVDCNASVSYGGVTFWVKLNPVELEKLRSLITDIEDRVSITLGEDFPKKIRKLENNVY